MKLVLIKASQCHPSFSIGHMWCTDFMGIHLIVVDLFTRTCIFLWSEMVTVLCCVTNMIKISPAPSAPLCSPCVTQYNMNPSDIDGQLYMPAPQRLQRPFPSTKDEVQLLVFQGRCYPSS